MESNSNEKQCGACELGKMERVVGNGITEPPYVFLIRCPYEKEYYMYPDDYCKHKKIYQGDKC